MLSPHAPHKRFGQHFLEPVWVDKVIAAIAPKPDEVFLEIGPGRGALTRPLAGAAGHVIAFEIDRDFASALRAAAPSNLTIEEGDFLRITPARLHALLAPLQAHTDPTRVRVAGNLPYNVASRILFELCALYSAGVGLVDATVMLQREVADRLTAPPGTRDYGVLTILIDRHAEAARVLTMPPGAFRPPPKVRSALVRLRFRLPAPPAADESAFAQMVQAVFTRRRKTLANALRASAGGDSNPSEALTKAGIDGRRRPETLSVEEFVRLSDALVTQSR